MSEKKKRNRIPSGHEGHVTIWRDIDVDELLIELRQILSADYSDLRTDESSAAIGRGIMSPTVKKVDIGALLAWIRVGARLFGSGSFPSLRQLRDEAIRVGLALAMGRVGTISEASRILTCSRKVLRENMDRAGLYPWPPQ
ncbi:MAG: hypothetical protein KDK70_36410 [Myxococcales bacterium]|nr:hypothetical protein [Myxococcales bacterium]